MIVGCRMHCPSCDFKHGQMPQLKHLLTVHSTQVHSPTVEGNSAPKTRGENSDLLSNQSVSEDQKLIHQMESFIATQQNNSSSLRNVCAPPKSNSTYHLTVRVIITLEQLLAFFIIEAARRVNFYSKIRALKRCKPVQLLACQDVSWHLITPILGLAKCSSFPNQLSTQKIEGGGRKDGKLCRRNCPSCNKSGELLIELEGKLRDCLLGDKKQTKKNVQ